MISAQHPNDSQCTCLSTQKLYKSTSHMTRIKHLAGIIANSMSSLVDMESLVSIAKALINWNGLHLGAWDNNCCLPLGPRPHWKNHIIKAPQQACNAGHHQSSMELCHWSHYRRPSHQHFLIRLPYWSTGRSQVFTFLFENDH